MVEAKKNRAQLDQIEVKQRFLRHYNRERLALAGKCDVLKDWDVVIPKSEPAESDLLANWLNTQANKSMAIKDGLILDFKRPLVINMLLAPNNFL